MARLRWSTAYVALACLSVTVFYTPCLAARRQTMNLAETAAAVPLELRRSVSEALAQERQLAKKPLQQNDSEQCADIVESRQGPTCPPSKYRSPSGECNNVRHRQWARSGDAFLRLIKPEYADGISKPRSSESLPGADVVARAMKRATVDTEHQYVDSMLAAWGQMLYDDLVLTANAKQEKSKCCRPGQPDVGECYGTVADGVCREYMRSAPTLNLDDCNFKHREQMNLATGFLDGSALYGNSEKELRSLRLYDGGKLDMKSCRKCNEQTPVAALYSLLVAEHNRIANELIEVNPYWDDTTLFLEARRALAAIIQHITYTEFLPVVLGEVGMAKSELRPSASGYARSYSSQNRAGVYNEIAVATLPVFASMMHKSMFNRTATISDLIKTAAHKPSMHFPSELATDDGWSFASSLLHRARDHGVADYAQYVTACGNTDSPVSTPTTFEDLEPLGIDKHHQEVMDMVYGSVSMMDLMVGALLEKPASGAVVGPTFACLLTQQFTNLKNSDRFWYENDLPPSSLSPPQLRALRRVSLAGLICANEDLQEVQPKAFVKEDPYLNAPQSCSQHQKLELAAWTDESGEAPEPISAEMVAGAVEKAKQEMMARKRLEYMLWEINGGADPHSSVGTAASFSKASPAALQLANSSLFLEFATNEIINSLGQNRRKRQIFETNLLGFSPSGGGLSGLSGLNGLGGLGGITDFADALQSVDASGVLAAGLAGPRLEPQCDETLATSPCDASSPFRSYTGHCNNLRNPNLGKSLTPFARLLPPVYEDGVSRPRINGVTGSPLPSPRTVSTVVHPDISNLHNRYSLMVMQYAQFLDHELTMTPIHKGFHESIPDCRSCDSPRTVHPECNPFPVPRGDAYYPEVNVTSGERLCFPSMRSLPGQTQLGPREQVNQNTAFIDASVIYGENPCVVRKLRGFGGRLNSTTHPVRGKELLPRSDSHPECKAASGYCFIAGDGRASEQPGLTAIHTIFMREHNRIVEGLRGVNPHWDGDRLFEHARRIVSAQLQHITYNEFLPRLLSWNAVNLYGLKLLPNGYYKEYSPTCNPSVVTEFSTAAFRIGHSLLRPHIPRVSHQHQPVDPPILLRDGFFKTDMFLQPSMTEEILRGLVSTPMETLDQFITGEVTNHLFEDRRIPFSGLDLIALNLQRGRDHGIPSYNNYRALCNLKRATTFDDLSREVPAEVIARFKRIYATVDDIDLFPGGMSERPLQGGLVGPTFACIIAIQFRQARKCDRFWYENEDASIRFTESQLGELRKTTLAKILCENYDLQSDTQRAAFDLPTNFLNPRVACHSLPQVDLSAWRESTTQGCHIAGRSVAVGDSAFPSPCTSCICTNEGAQCASLRITDCAQLMREWSLEAVSRDDVCAAQCGGALAAGSSFAGDLLPPPRQARRNPLPSLFPGFKLPDLTPFISK